MKFTSISIRNDRTFSHKKFYLIYHFKLKPPAVPDSGINLRLWIMRHIFVLFRHNPVWMGVLLNWDRYHRLEKGACLHRHGALHLGRLPPPLHQNLLGVQAREEGISYKVFRLSAHSGWSVLLCYHAVHQDGVSHQGPVPSVHRASLQRSRNIFAWIPLHQQWGST